MQHPFNEQGALSISGARAHRRFQLTAAVTVHRQVGEVEEQFTAKTRDISEGGVFILTSEALAVGNEVLLEVLLRQVEESIARGLSLTSRGTVVRLAGAGEQPGFAVQAHFAIGAPL